MESNSLKKLEEMMIVQGSGGGGKKSSTDDTVKSRAYAKVIDAISEGPIEGLVDGENSIFINRTPLPNVKEVLWQYREGLPDDTPMTGFDTTETFVTVSSEVTQDVGPVIRTITDSSLDAVKIYIGLNVLYYTSSKGALKTTDSGWRIAIRPAGGAWTEVVTEDLNSEKTTAPVQYTYTIPLSGVGPWDISVSARFPNREDDDVTENISWTGYSGVTYGKFVYPNTALIGLEMSAEHVGSSMPSRHYHVRGRKVKVPTNYDPITRAYTGAWDGNFKTAWTNCPPWILYDIIENDVFGVGDYVDVSVLSKWRLYAIAQYCDELVPSGYKDSEGENILEPRYTFNGAITDKQQALDALRSIVSTWRGMGYYSLAQFHVTVDQPQDPTLIYSPANVKNGRFEYSNSSIKARHSVVMVRFNDPNNLGESATEVVIDNDLIHKIGWREKSLDLTGCTSRSLAHRYGKWVIETEREETETVTFSVGLDSLHALPGEIIQVNDPRKARARMGGRVSGIDSANLLLMLDAPVPDAISGDLVIRLQKTDGTVISVDGLISAADRSVIELMAGSNVDDVPVNAVYLLSSEQLVPKKFRIITIEEDTPQGSTSTSFQIVALAYDETKFARVEQGIYFDAPVTSIVVPATTAPRTFASEVRSYVEGTQVRNDIEISWEAPSEGSVREYRVFAATPAQKSTLVGVTNQTSFTLPTYETGDFSFLIIAISYTGAVSDPLQGSVSVQGIDAINVGYVADLANAATLETGSATFSGRDVRLSWRNMMFVSSKVGVQEVDSESALYSHTLLKFYFGTTLVRTQRVTGNTFIYTFDMNKEDAVAAGLGGPQRYFTVKASVVDRRGRASEEIELTLLNPTPSAITPVVEVRDTALLISWPASSDEDARGTLVWVMEDSSPVAGVAPTAEVAGNSFEFAGSSVTTYYVSVAAYDAFGKTGLNYAAPVAATTNYPGADTEPAMRVVDVLPEAGAYIDEVVLFRPENKLYRWTGTAWVTAPTEVVIDDFPENLRPIEVVADLPTTGNFEGRVVMLSTDGKLYRYHDDEWTSAVPAVDIDGQIIGNQITDGVINTAKFAAGIRPVEIVATLPTTGNTVGRVVVLTTDNKMYRWTGSAWTAAVAAVDMTGQLSSAQLAAIEATKLIGTISEAQIANGSISGTKFASGLTPNEIVNALPTTGNFVGRTVFLTTDNKLYRRTATSWTAAVSTVDLTGVITATQIADAAVTDAKIAGMAASKVTGQLTDGQIAQVAAAKLTGQIVTAQIADAALTTAKFASGVRPVEVLSSLPSTGNFAGRMVFLTSDNKLYRHLGTPTNASGFSSAVPAADVSGQLTDSQIANLTTAKLTGVITSLQIADAAVTDAKIAGLAAGKVTGQLSSAQIAALDAAKLTGTVAPARIADGSLTDAKVAALAASKVTGQLTDAQIAAVGAAKLTGQIVTAQIADAALTTAKFASGITPVEIVASLPATANFAGRTVVLTTDGKLYRYASGAWTSSVPAADIAGQVAAAQVAALEASKITGTLTSGQIAALDAAKLTGTLNVARIANGALTDAKISGVAAGKVTGTLTDAQIAALSTAKLTGQIATTQITDNAITTAKVAANAITATEIAASTIVAGNIASNAITTAKIAAGAITAAVIAAGTITATQIAATSITGDRLLANTITAAQIEANTLTASEIAANAITTSELASNAVTAVKISAGAIIAGKIAAGAIVAADIAAGTITGDRIASNTVTASQIAANTITAGQIAAGAITATEISVGAITASKISIGDFSNIVPDADISEAASWGLPSDWSIVPVTGLSEIGSLGRLRYTYPGSGSGYAGAASSSKFPVSQNSPFFFGYTIRNAGNGKLWGRVHWFDLNGASLGSGENVDYSSIDNTARVSSGFYQVGKIITPPSGARSAEFRFYPDLSGTNSEISIGGITCRRAASGELIVNGAITADKVATNSLTAAEIAANAITTSELASSAVTATNIAAGAIVAGKIAAGTIVAADIAADTITASQIAANAITTSELASGSVTTANLVANVITANEIASNAVVSAKIAAGAITAGKIAANVITATEIASATILAGNIVSNTLTANEIASNAITVNELAANAVTAAKIVAGTITATQIAANTITGNEIAANTITAGNIAANTITAGQIAAGAISATEIAAGAITAKTLTLGDFTNLVPNGDLSDPYVGTSTADLWDSATNGNLTYRSDYPDAAPYSLFLQKNAPSGSTNVVSKFFIPVEGGANYYGSCRLWTNSATPASNGAYFRVQWYTTAQVPCSTAYTDIIGNHPFSGAVAEAGREITAPADAAFARIQLYNHSTQTVTSNLFFGALRLRKMMTGSMIVDGAITASKVVAGSITAAKLAAETITAAEIASNAITSAKIAAGQVTAGKVAANAITATEIASATILAGNIVSNTITATQIAADTITAGQIAANAITVSELASNSVNAGKIVAGSITASEIASNAITSAKIAANTIVAADIAANTITAGQIAATTITASEIAVGTITGDKIAATTITGGNIVGGTISADKLVANSITSGQIAAGAISASEIAAGAITATKLAIGDTSNMAPDWSQGVYDGWSFNGFLNWTNDTQNGDWAGWRLEANGRAQAAMTTPIQVTPGESYYFSVWVRNEAPEAANIMVELQNANTSARTWPVPASTTVKNVFVKIEGILVIPDGYHTMKMLLQVPKTGTGNGASTFWTKPVMRRAASGELIVDGAITAGKIAALTITGNEIAANSVHADKLVANSITAGRIAAGTIGATEIAAEAITAVKIAAGAIQSSHITVGTLLGDRIQTGTLNANRIVANSITTTQIAANTITGTQIVADTITGDKIAANTITAAKITANTITGDKIAANTITADLVAANAITADKIMIGDFQNLNLDPDYTLGTNYWTGGAISANTDPLFRSSNILSLSGGTSVSVYSGAFRVLPGEQIYVGMSSRVSSGSGGAGADMRMQFDSTQAFSTVTDVSPVPAINNTSITVATKGGYVTVPDGCYWGRVRLYKPAVSGSLTGVEYGLVEVRRVAGGELIVDGAITASKLSTGELITLGAQIKDAVIDTLKVKNGAITNRFAAFTATSTSLTGSYQTVQTLDIDCDGQPVTIQTSLEIDGILGAKAGIYLDGVLQREFSMNAGVYNVAVGDGFGGVSTMDFYFPVSFTTGMVIYPSSGSRQVDVKVKRGPDYRGSGSVSNILLTTVENKR